MLLLFQENKDLIHTMRQILQQFPEGVIIQDFNKKTQSFMAKYANSNARNEILNLDSTGSVIDISDSSARIKVLDDLENAKSRSIEKFLETQNLKLKELKETQKSINAMVSLFEAKSEFVKTTENEEKVKYYNIKTMKVAWEKNSDSFMHIFIDTTNMKKLGEIRARNSCQQIMFASVSHEFRTPLNVFENSLNLIKIKLDVILEDIKPYLKVKIINKTKKNSNSIDKFITMGKIQSKLLMNLVEDILDLEKFDSGTFKLNINYFTIAELIEDISYIFKVQ